MPKYDDKDVQAAIAKEAKRQRLFGQEVEDFDKSMRYALETYSKLTEHIKKYLIKRQQIQEEINKLESSNKKLTEKQTQQLSELKDELSEARHVIDVTKGQISELTEDFTGFRHVMETLADEGEKTNRVNKTAKDTWKSMLNNAREKAGISKEEAKQLSVSLKADFKAREENRKARKARREAEKKLEEEQKKLWKAEGELSDKQIASLKGWVTRRKKALEEAEQEIVDAKERNTEKIKQANKDLFVSTLNVMGELGEKLGSVIDKNIATYTQYMGTMNARLQGGTTSYGSVVENVSSRLAISPFVKQADVLKNIQSLVSSGVAFNVEQRGFLMTLADKIAPTFEANSEALLRLVRLQGEDTTAQRLGLEAALTRSLNATFKDTAYLNNLFDTIRDAIFDAESQLDKESATEFEYNTQKWLSSIYSVGGSSTFITNLAQGINMLGTGDVTGLAGNESLQTLLAMALSRSGSGLTYSDVLLGGLNASSVNEVLYQVIEYLQEIEKNSRDNMVIRSQYARLFGMSVADFAALTNLSNDMMSGLRGQNINYQGFTDELTSQFWTLATPGQRMSVGEMVQNALDNVVTGLAAGIAQSPALLTAWQLNNLVEDLTGGINIPFISALGSGVDLNANLNQLVKLGIGGFSLIGQIGNIISSIQSLGGLNLDEWVTEQNMRGGGFVATTAGVSTGLSESVRYQGSSSYGDMEQETLQTATTRAQDVGEITSAGVDTTKKTSDDIWQAMFSEDSPYAVRVKLVEVDPSILSVPVRITDQGLGSSEQEALYIRSSLYSSDTP